MNTLRGFVRFVVEKLYIWLVGFYPGRFRASFRDEFEEIIPLVIDEADAAGGFVLFGTALREVISLVVSIIKEWWHELKSRKERLMNSGKDSTDTVATGGGGAPVLGAVGTPGLKWIPKWTLLTTVAFPAALITIAPFSALILAFLSLGVRIGLWPSFDNNVLRLAGFILGFSLALSLTQWFLLRNYLPHAWQWLLATGAGVLIGGILAGLGNIFIANPWGNSRVGLAIFFLPIGCFLGLAHWLVLRRKLPNAYWIISIDVIGVCVLLLAGFTITNLPKLILFVLIFTLPGLITGGGLWYLFKQSQPKAEDTVAEKKIDRQTRSLSRGRRWLLLVALVPMFFLGIWIYASSQLALAKHEGVYPSVREGMIEMNSEGWGGAEVVSVQVVSARANRHDGGQPHVWYAIADITLDRVPAGFDRTSYSGGSFFVHVRDGWVHLAEGTFPSFIG